MTKLTYEEAKKRLDTMFDLVAQTNIHQNSKLFSEMLQSYNQMDNLLWEVFHDTDREEY